MAGRYHPSHTGVPVVAIAHAAGTVVAGGDDLSGSLPTGPLHMGLAGGSEAQWHEHARALALRGEIGAAATVLSAALAEHPASAELRFALAGALAHLGQVTRAQEMLREVLDHTPDATAAALLLARLLNEKGRIPTMADVLRTCFESGAANVEALIQAIEMLDDAGCQQHASVLCERYIAAGSTDPRLYAHSGMLLSQLGQFDLARERRLRALNLDQRALDWHVPLGLAEQQRYFDHQHPDLALFEELLRRPSLSRHARAGLLFALGKAHDDLGNYAQATGYLRQANTLAHETSRWSRKLWRRSIEARIARRLPPIASDTPDEWTPVFLVGVPRSGTTVLAERLARHPAIVHRGELPWLPRLAKQWDAIAHATEASTAMSRMYAAHLIQESPPMGWFLDKQPLNLLHVDLIVRMFPRARVVCCTRSPRDTALSLWMQSFQPGAHDYAYDLADIETFIRGSRRLMAHWQARFPHAVTTIAYETLTTDPHGCLDQLAGWLGLPAIDWPQAAASMPQHSISTASLWQARQPLHHRSVGRWRNYAVHLPELLRLPDR